VSTTDDPALFNRLVPVLAVLDLAAERDFYIRLGFTVTDRRPGLVTLTAGAVEFGLERRVTFNAEHAARTLSWQIRVHTIDQVRNQLRAAGLPFREERTTHDDEARTVLQVTTPNSYRLVLHDSA
jgi:hypothetical protein